MIVTLLFFFLLLKIKQKNFIGRKKLFLFPKVNVNERKSLKELKGVFYRGIEL